MANMQLGYIWKLIMTLLEISFEQEVIAAERTLRPH